MGQTTPNGVTELKTSPQEPNPAAGFDMQPDDFANITNEFFATLENAVAADPEAEDAVNLLIREIQETTGLHTEDPDMQAQAATRIEHLNAAIQDSNMPDEIKASFDNVYTASMDSPQYLNVLNGFILQGGGSIAGIAGAAQRLNAEEVAKRNEADNRASAAATASMVYTVQERIQQHLDDFFERNAKAFADAAAAAYQTEQTQGSEAAARQYVEELTPLQIEELNAYRLENPDATDEELRELVEGMLEGSREQLTAAGASTETADHAEEIGRQQLLSRAGLLERDLSDFGQDGIKAVTETSNKATDLMAYFAAGIDFTLDSIFSSNIEKKDDLRTLVDSMFEESSNDIVNQRLALAEMKQEYETLNAEINSFFGQFQSAIGLNEEEQALLDQMGHDIAEQEYILSLREEVNALGRSEVEGLFARIETPSDIDVDFLKQAFLNINPELAAKTAELNSLMGLENQNPIAQMQALLENQGITLTDDQRADLTEFIEAVTAAREDVESAQAWKDSERERAEYAAMNNPDGIYIPQDHGMRIGFSPIMQTDGRYLAMAMEEERNALANLASLRLGVEVDALPEFAVEQEAVLQQLSRETSIDQSQINDILVGMGLYDDNLDAANAHIAQNLIDQHNIEVTGSLPSEEPAVISGPEPEAPSSLLPDATLMAQELAAMESVSRADFENILYRNNWDGPSHDDMAAMLEAELRELKPDFEFAEMSIEDQIIMAFIENQGTLSQQDIQLVISESGIEGTEFQAVFDEMVAKYSNHKDFSIDPPIASAADEYAPDEQDIAAADPAAAQPSDPQPQQEEQDYAHTHTGQSPTVL